MDVGAGRELGLIARSSSSSSMRIRCCAAGSGWVWARFGMRVCVWVYFLGSGSRLSKEGGRREGKEGEGSEEDERRERDERM